MNVDKKQQEAIKFIARDIARWNREFPIYFTGNFVALTACFGIIGAGLLFFLMLGGESINNNFFAVRGGENYFWFIVLFVSIGTSGVYIFGRGFLRNVIMLSDYFDRKTKLDERELSVAYEILSNLPTPIDEIEKKRSADAAFDKVFVILLVCELAIKGEKNFEKADYHSYTTWIEMEKAFLKMKKDRQKKKSN